MPNPQKALIVSELREISQNSKGAFLTDYRGLTVAEISKLRKRLRESNAEFHIVKNTLYKLALGGVISTELDELLKGPTAIVFAKDDIVAPAKTILDFVREAKKPEVKVKGGYIDGKVFDVAQVTAISKLPSREQIIGQLIGTLNAPASDLVGTLNGIVSEFVRTVQAIADQQSTSDSVAA